MNEREAKEQAKEMAKKDKTATYVPINVNGFWIVQRNSKGK